MFALCVHTVKRENIVNCGALTATKCSKSRLRTVSRGLTTLALCVSRLGMELPTIKQVGIALQAFMAARDLSYRDAAIDIGISHATLYRAAQGMPMSADHYIRLVKKVWKDA
jgi:hypothetical protein